MATKVNLPWLCDKTTRMLVMVAGVVVAVCAISDQSFWIDEVHTAWKACQPTLHQWWHEALAERGSDIQMPFYMLYAWSWEKLFGCSEWWLRAANVPWLLLGFVAFARRRTDLVVAALISPFAWYYAGEARPYAMQVGASLLVFASLDRLFGHGGDPSSQDNRAWRFGLAWGLVMLAGSSLVAMYWAGVAVGVTLVAVSPERVARTIRAAWPVWALAAAALLGLAGYYAWTLRSGASAYSGSPSGLSNLLYIGYELLGFSGLGPGRLAIRAGGLEAFRGFVVPLATYGCLLAAVLWSALATVRNWVPRRPVIAAAVFLAGAVLALLLIGHVRNVRLLGRHFAPFVACVLWCIAAGLRSLWLDRRWSSRAVAVAFVTVTLASCFSLRFAPRHARDAYREAAAEARAALMRGETVWWNADFIAGRFYGVALREEPARGPGEAWQVTNRGAAELDRAPVPDLVVTSKPDLYDETAALADYLGRNRFRAASRLPAFMLWRR